MITRDCYLLSVNDAIAKRIVGFEVKEESTKSKQNIPEKIVSKLKFDTKAVNKIEKKASDILTKDGYTKEGAKFINEVRAAVKDASNTVVVDGVKYFVVEAITEDVKAVKGAGYELEINLKAYKTSTPEDEIPAIQKRQGTAP